MQEVSPVPSRQEILMKWFGKAKKDGVIAPLKPNLDWMPKREEFTPHGVEDLNPHLGSFIVEAKELIPE